MQEPKWEADTLYSPQFGDLYFSKEGGKAESRLVFWEGNDLDQRCQTRLDRPFKIGELGFGTGLNFLVTWEELRKKPNPSSLHFFTVEKFPLPLVLWQEIPEKMSFDFSWEKQTLDAYDWALQSYQAGRTGFYEIAVPNLENVHLHLFLGDVVLFLEALVEKVEKMDAWYLDGFSPAKNPAMWDNTVFEGIRKSSAENASFATFSSAGFVRRGLEAVGFQVEKKPGFGRKRERIVGKLL